MNIALIPAKSKSRRIPNKNFMNFCGKPLFMWSVLQAQESELIDMVVTSTDSDEIALLSDKYIMRPKSLCQDYTTQEQVIGHAIETLQLKDDDNIVLLQPTSPLRLRGDIDRCIKSGANVISVIDEPDIFLWDSGGNVTFNSDNRDLREYYVRETGSIYKFQVSSFNNWGNSRYGDGLPKYFYQQKWQQFEIDEPEDIPIVEWLFRKYILKEGA